MSDIDKNNAHNEMEKSVAAVVDPSLKATLTRLMNSVKQSNENKGVEEFKKEILKAPIKPEQQIMSFLPHQLAKTSIFFPMSHKELKGENRRINKIEQETGWGKVVIEGVKLAIYEEDIFLALIKIAKDNIKRTGSEYILETNMKDVVNLLYGSAGYTKQSFERIERALQNFQLVRFELTTYDWKKKGHERLKARIVRSIGSVIISYKIDEKSKNLIIYFNPHFFAYFLESMLTNINFTIRRKLKKDGSKALARFLSAHTNPGKMHILTVLKAINYNVDQPMYTLRKKIKQFIIELKKQGVLGPKTKLYKTDIILFDVLPHKNKAIKA